MNNKKLPLEFYQHRDVLSVSTSLLGKYVLSFINGELAGGMIVETEAYRAPKDRASHAYNMRRTNRNEVMYGPGGHAYIYLCYGLYSLLNIITNEKDIPEGVLVRAIEPLIGLPIIAKRRGKEQIEPRLTSGPGLVSQALGLTYRDNGESLVGNRLWIEDRGIKIPKSDIIASPRVGVDYAGEDASLPWRFRIKNNKWTSRAK